MNIYRSKSISRFGLMHMIATNLCVWLNVLIMETHHEIVDFRKPHDDDGGGGGHHHGGHGNKNHTVVETVESKDDPPLVDLIRLSAFIWL